jgi:hypothetical protein
MALDRVLEVVETTGCTRFAAYDAANFPIDHVEVETAGELCDELRALIGQTSGMIRLVSLSEIALLKPAALAEIADGG